MAKEKCSAEKSLRSNFIYNTFYQILSICTPLITSPIISRRLGAENIGIHTYTYSVAYFFLLLGMLGTRNYGNRSIARVSDDRKELSRIFWSIYFFQIGSTVLISTIYLFYLITLGGINRTIAAIQILWVVSGIFDVSWLFFGLEQFKLTIIRDTIVRLVSVVLIVLVVRQPQDLWKYSLIIAGGTLVSQFVMWPFVKKVVDFERVGIKEICAHLKPNVILFIPVIATNLFKYVDKVMLGSMKELTQLGFYENAEKLSQIPICLVTALGTVMLPRMSSLAKKGNSEEFLIFMRRSIYVSIFMCSALCFGLMGVAEVFVPFFFGKEFVPSICVVYVLAPTMLLVCWSNVIRTQYLIPQMKDMVYLMSHVTACVVNFAVNLLLIPKFGAMGAAIGTFCAEFVVFLVQNLLVAKKLPIGKYLTGTFPFCLIGLLMGCVIYNINMDNRILSLTVRVGLGACIYVPLSLLYLYFFQRDLLDGLKKR